jgi:hypothetical protein
MYPTVCQAQAKMTKGLRSSPTKYAWAVAGRAFNEALREVKSHLQILAILSRDVSVNITINKGGDRENHQGTECM